MQKPILHKLYDVPKNDKEFSEEVIVKISDLTFPHTRIKHFEDFVPAQRIVGGVKFVKALEKWLNSQWKIPKEEMERIHEEVSKIVSNSKAVIDLKMDFHPVMDPPQGYFNDSSSCFYGESHKKDRFRAIGTIFGRLWRPIHGAIRHSQKLYYPYIENRLEYSKLIPYGRFFLIPHEEGYIVSNLYSYGGLGYAGVASMVADILETRTHPFDAHISTNWDIYTNGGPHYSVSDTPIIKTLDLPARQRGMKIRQRLCSVCCGGFTKSNQSSGLSYYPTHKQCMRTCPKCNRPHPLNQRISPRFGNQELFCLNCFKG